LSAGVSPKANPNGTGSVRPHGYLVVLQLDRTTLSCAYPDLVEIAQSLVRVFLTGGYLVFIPLGREHTPTLRIKVGTIGCATPIGEPTTRVVIDVSVADKVRLAV
jgi:hypothetical protein